MKLTKGKIIAAVAVIAVLAGAFWYGGNAPGLQGWTVQEQESSAVLEAAPPAITSAAAIFSCAVMPPSSPPGRDASPSGEGVGVSGAADSVGAGVSEGFGVPGDAGVSKAPAVSVGSGLLPSFPVSSGVWLGCMLSSTGLLSRTPTVHPWSPGALPPYQKAAARITRIASAPITFPFVSFISFLHRPPAAYTGSKPDTVLPYRSTRFRPYQ